MEKDRDKSDLTVYYEGQSLSELDRGFITDISMSALAIEATLKPPRGIVVEYSDPRPTLPASFNHSCNILSPSNAPSKNYLPSPSNARSKTGLLSPNNTLTSGLTGLVEGQSSTPYERIRFQKPALASSLDLSCIDLTASHPSWEVSLIKPAVESPKPYLESSKLEATWSPSFQSAPQTLAEISSLIWSGSPAGKSATFQDSNLLHAVLEITEEQQKSLSRNTAM